MYRSFPKGRRALTGRVNRQPRSTVSLSSIVIAGAAVALLGMGALAVLNHIAAEAY